MHLSPTPDGGGLSMHRTISANDDNATSVTARASRLYGWYVSNVNANECYLKIYDSATAPTVGTDTPVLTLLIPGNTAGGGANVEFTNGIKFSNGIGFGIVTGVADNDSTAPAANEVVVNLFYK